MLTKKELDNLPREQKIKLLKYIEEQKRREDNSALARYNQGDKVHEKQIVFHKDSHRIRGVFGGNRTGKTECGVAEALWYARGNHPYKDIKRATSGWIVSLTNEVQRDVVQKKILDYIDKDWIVSINVRKGRRDDPYNAVIDNMVIKSIHGGNSVIGFKSCDQGREKFQGTAKDWIQFDEEPPKEIYDECRMRLIDRKGDMWITMTPLKGISWVVDLIYHNEGNDPNISSSCWEWADNPFLPQEEIAMLMATLTEEEREARQYGRPVALSGLVYKEFRDDIHVIDPIPIPLEWHDKISLDPGLDAPLSCHFYACDGDGNVYVIAEHYQAGRNVTWHAEQIHKIAKQIGWRYSRTKKLKILADTDANKRTLSGERSVTDLFRDHGILLDTQIDKSLDAGIPRVKMYLEPRFHEDTDTWTRGKPKLFIFRTCPNMIREFKKYRWKEASPSDPEPDKPKKGNDHAMDELRYYLMSKPHPYLARRKLLRGTYLYQELKLNGYTDAEIRHMVNKNMIKLIGGKK